MSVTLKLTTIRRIATDVVEGLSLPFDVVAARRSVRSSAYVEILLSDWESRSGPGWKFVGVNDWMSESQMRQAIAAQLTA